jgi:hypothetical protein
MKRRASTAAVSIQAGSDSGELPAYNARRWHNLIAGSSYREATEPLDAAPQSHSPTLRWTTRQAARSPAALAAIHHSGKINPRRHAR